jgi:hypothetical protein
VTNRTESFVSCNFGLRIAECGLKFTIPQSEIRNRQFCVAMAASIVMLFTAVPALAVELRVGTFNIDVTPPVGTPLCDALVPPMTGINDPLTARGIVLLADGEPPVVLVAVDWVGIGNEGHDAWRRALAKACNTSVERVCVHTLHQHDAPGCDFLADEIASEAGLGGQLFHVEFAREAIHRAATAAAEAATHAETVTHVGRGMGRVEKVASNRRILGADGKVQYERMSACRDPKIRDMPEGTIDPNVRLVSFWNAKEPLAVLSYYATHPQSYYYTGKTSADFVGMARDQAQAAEKTQLHLHFNGAGGDLAAGKYNDGSPANRPVLAGRLAAGMKAAWDAIEKVDVASLAYSWETRDVNLPVADWYDERERLAILNDANQKLAPRLQAARAVAWARRTQAGHKICIARLRLGSIDILHMPGELFVEYQLAAQKLRPESFVCVAAYGDYGPGYIGTSDAYAQGGYETSIVSRVSPRAETILMGAIQNLLQ